MILGIDPSITASGYVALHTDNDMHNSATLPLNRKLKGSHRLLGLQNDLIFFYYELHQAGLDVELAVLEDLPRNAMGSGLTGMAQGIVRAFLVDKEIPFVTIAPATLKKAVTGSGKADKKEMKAAVERVNPGHAEWLRNDNEVDAWGLAQVGLHYMNRSNNLLFTENLKDKIKEGT